MKNTNVYTEQFLSGGGEMGELIRAYDWTTTPLGSPENWPLSLKTSVAIMLRSGYTIFVWWGQEMIMFYNDAYRPVLGKKHPYALGKPAKEIWAEIWEQIGPMMDQVLNKGEQIYAQDLLFLIERKGFIEESYFTFSYSPIPDDEGGVGGIFCACNEETSKVLRQRRLKTLKDISTLTAQLRTVEEVLTISTQIISENPHDIPFALLYTFDSQTYQAKLAGYTGFSSDKHNAMAKVITLGKEISAWPTDTVIQTGKTLLVENIHEKFQELPGGPWSESPQKAMIVPIQKSGQEQVVGFLILAISPKLEFDDEYRSYFDLIAGQISTAIANVNAFEEERKRAEALAEIDKAKTIFFNNISHEFRTPLTLMLGPLENLIDEVNGKLSQEEKESIEATHRNAMRLLRLVNTLLDFSRIEAERVQAHYYPIDLARFTEDLASSFRSIIENAGIQFEINCNKISDAVYVDREMWEKIVLNLLSNAFKYTLKGKIEITLTEENKTVFLGVKDTGVGIPKKELPHMFERFHRVKNLTGRTYEGTGIGLSLVNELVKFHKGKISVESEEGKGTMFTIAIPAGKDHLPAAQVHDKEDSNYESVLSDLYITEAVSLAGNEIQKVNEQLSSFSEIESKDLSFHSPNKKLSVLVVDDNADMRSYISRLLEKNYHVQTATDGKDALTKIKRSKPDLVISDIMMPVMDGIELLNNIKNNVETNRLPVILLSARAGEEAKIAGYNLGADDYLIKPFSAKELLARVRSQIRTANIRAAAEAHLRNLFIQAPVAIAIYRGPDFIIELANEKVLEFWGKTAEQVMNKPLFEALPEVEKNVYYPILKNVYTTGERFFAPEYRATLLRNGKLETVYVNFTLEPLRDLEGNITSVMVVANEVTALVEARKMAEQNAIELEKKVQERTSELLKKNLELQEQKNFVETVIDSSIDLICVYDKDCRFLAMNKRCAEMSHVDQRSVVGKKFEEVYPSLINSEIHNRLKLALKGEPSLNISHASVNSSSFYNVFFIPLSRNGESYGAVVIAHDNTEIMKAAEKLNQVNKELIRTNRELEQFAYIASHDLQEPLRKIQFYSDLLQTSSYDENFFAKYFNKITSSAERMMALIKAVLNYSHLAKDRDEFQQVDLNKVLEDVKTDFELLIAEKNAVITNDTLPVIRGIPLQLNQLFSNLISNSLKFSNSEPRIEISCNVLDTSENAKPSRLNDDFIYTEINFKDNGIGFESQYAKQIFTIFQRLNKNKYSGTGIGLALCKKICENHEGLITVESEVNKGTTFHVYLPVMAKNQSHVLSEDYLIDNKQNK